MRFIILFFLLVFFLDCFPQQSGKILISGIIINTDSIPVPDVAIINIRSGKTVRTNTEGFFQTELDSGDSLLVYHISYKKLFLNEKNNVSRIMIEPEIQEIIQVDIVDKYRKELENLKKTEEDIKQLAPLKKLTGYDLHSKQEYFIAENGSHNKGFSPFFGPTIPVPISKITSIFAKMDERHKRKKLTSHYHLVKDNDEKD